MTSMLRTPILGLGRPRRPMLRLSRPALRRPQPAVRHLWLVPGLAIAFTANGQAEHHGLGLVPVLLFGIVPHATVLAGRFLPHERGQLAPPVVPIFNAMHHPLMPLLVLGLAGLGVLSAFWFVGALAWLSHVVIDWAMGDGLRTADGWGTTRSIWNGRPAGVVALIQRRRERQGAA